MTWICPGCGRDIPHQVCECKEPDLKHMWPPCFVEMNIGGDVQINPEDIANYSYPPWRKERYTLIGYGKAMILMAEFGVPIPAADLDVRYFGATQNAVHGTKHEG